MFIGWRRPAYIEIGMKSRLRFPDGESASGVGGARAESMEEVLVKIWRVLRDFPEAREALMVVLKEKKDERA